jgi:hypothetical protein
MVIQVCDEAAPGGARTTAAVQIPAALTNVREILQARVRQEVERYNEKLPDTFQGLVQPEESERILNGYRLETPRALDWEVQFRKACSSFERNGFLVLVDDRQITTLDEPVEVRSDSQVIFLKLVPLMGG